MTIPHAASGRPYRVLGHLAAEGGVVLMICGLPGAAYLARDTALPMMVTAMLAAWAVGVAVAGLGLLLLRRARQLDTPSGEEVLQRDARRPVLYLRSFADDAATHKLFSRWLTRMNYATEEEELALAFAAVGPLVAVGQPGEKLPNVGAARLYFADDEWQAQVEALMSRASLVLLRSGASAGLLWELSRAAERVEPRRLVLIVGDDAEAFARFWRDAQKALPVRVVQLRTEGGVGSMRGFVTFDAAWTPRYLPLRKSQLHRTLAHPYLAEITLALRPVFEALALPWHKPRPAYARIAAVLIAALVAYYASTLH